MALEHKHFITPEEYLEIDRASQDVKYVLVNTQCQLVEVFQRQSDGNLWLYQQFGPGQEVDLASIGLKFPLAAFYDLTSVPVEEEGDE